MDESHKDEGNKPDACEYTCQMIPSSRTYKTDQWQRSPEGRILTVKKQQKVLWELDLDGTDTDVCTHIMFVGLLFFLLFAVVDCTVIV